MWDITQPYTLKTHGLVPLFEHLGEDVCGISVIFGCGHIQYFGSCCSNFRFSLIRKYMKQMQSFQYKLRRKGFIGQFETFVLLSKCWGQFFQKQQVCQDWSYPRHPKSSKYMVSWCLEPPKSRTSGDVWRFKHLPNQLFGCLGLILLGLDPSHNQTSL